MKVTIYELLGMVKDGKLPKMIKYHFQSEFEEFYVETLFEILRDADATLYDEVEILDDEDEERSKVPIKLYGLEMLDEDMSHEIAIAKQRYNNGRIRTKINEIIDYLEKQSKGE